ncbi:DUF6402 family protein [Pseudacidovorax sp. NFM-22]|uniref:DUF6402 family protein n=1 Tax=Pseudacidovorax sp. NFM-22 TaxID=2744469 RepID=UPI001F1E3489|nr:DUF6402 family protein [Pseudacidovorax sp. NFM-22]
MGQARAGDARVTFLKSNNFWRTWKPEDGNVCTSDDVCLRLDRAPPKLLHPPPSAQTSARPAAPPAPPPRRPAKKDPAVAMLESAIAVAEAVGTFKAWLRSPPPPPRPAPPPPAAPAPKPVPPFDIQDVPKAMRKLAMPMAAKLQERWFAGYENYSRTPDDLRDELDQHGTRYAKAMVDETTITMDWVLSFPRAKRMLTELVELSVYQPKALTTLRAKLRPYVNRGFLIAWNEAADFLDYHKKFQFQFASVNATWGQRIASFLDRSLVADGVPDDLTGALGSFNLYAAVKFASFQLYPASAVLHEVFVYVRDPYEFSDEQYLGHWNSEHVAVVPAHQVAGGWLKYPVVQGNPHAKDAVLYPVTNADYRAWRQKHGRGGDFLIYTKPLSVRLPRPLRISL